MSVLKWTHSLVSNVYIYTHFTYKKWRDPIALSHACVHLCMVIIIQYGGTATQKTLDNC